MSYGCTAGRHATLLISRPRMEDAVWEAEVRLHLTHCCHNDSEWWCYDLVLRQTPTPRHATPIIGSLIIGTSLLLLEIRQMWMLCCNDPDDNPKPDRNRTLIPLSWPTRPLTHSLAKHVPGYQQQLNLLPSQTQIVLPGEGFKVPLRWWEACPFAS